MLPLLVVGLTGMWVALAGVLLLYAGSEAVRQEGRWAGPTSGELEGVLQGLTVLVVASLLNRWATRWWARNHAPPRADQD